MQYLTPACQPQHPPTGETSRNVPHDGGTPCPTNTTPSANLRVPPALQWISTTTGRAAKGHAWLMAVHWAADPKAKRYTPSRNHGPKRMNTTTLRLAQELANLTVCRPGIAYLMRKLKMSERSIEYHLDMLREAGLLVYRFKGSNVPGRGGQASVFERTIPLAYDDAHGIRTVGEGVQRRPVGADRNRAGALGKLAKKAARRVRKPRRKPAAATASDSSTGQGRCTLRDGGTSTSSSADVTTDPPEAKRASGNSQSPTPKKPNRSNSPKTRKPRVLNKVGRRHQLARQLVQRVWWLNRAAVPRIAWIIRDVSDAGWTADEVIAWLNLREAPTTTHRPSGLLAARLTGATAIWKTPQARAEAAEKDRESRRAERERHVETTGQTQGPNSRYVQRLVADAIHQMRRPAPTPAATDLNTTADPDQGPLALEDLTRAEVLDLRATADRDPGVIGLAIDLMGETYARRLYTNHRVNQYKNPAPAHMTIGA